MKHFLKSVLYIGIIIGFSTESKAQSIFLQFTNRKLSDDGLTWTFDLEGKGNVDYLAPNSHNWQSFNIRLDLTLPAGVSIVIPQSFGAGNPTYTTVLAGVQAFAPGPPPPPGKTVVGLTLSRTAQTDLNLNDFVKLATYTVRFSGPVQQENPAEPRPNPVSSGSSWVNLASPQQRPFIFVDPSFPLPVKLISFSAQKEGGTAQLKWETSEETNSDRFDVQRSKDGKRWATIQTVAAAGESRVNQHYSAVDINPLNGDNLYRLHMIDKDGSSAYSAIQSVRFDIKSDFTMFPNPLSDQLSIKTAEDWSKVEKIQIYNMQGKEVYKSGGKPARDIDLKHLAGGMYVVKVTQKNNTSSDHKIVIAK